MKVFGNPSMLLVQIEATTRAVAAADEVHRCDAIESVSWERCGLLQRLTRADRPESLRLEVASVIRTPVLEPAS